MPVYEYLDENGHETTITHRMEYSTGIVCTVCGLEMWRKPASGVNVTWGGLAPSQGEQPDFIKNHLADVNGNRARNDEKYQNKKEQDGITTYTK